MYADIIVDISHEQLDKTFQYRIPSQMEEQIQVGDLVNIPFGRGNRMIKGYVIELSEEPKFDVERIKFIDSIDQDRVRAVGKMIQLAAWLRHNYGSTMNQALKTVIPVKDKIRQKEKKSVRLIAPIEEANEYLVKMQKKNATARVRLLEALLEDEVIDCEMIRNKLNISMSVVHALENQGLVEIEIEEMYRNPIPHYTEKEKRLILNQEQQQIIDKVCTDYDQGIRKTYLIHGVTGSGKTLCYIQLIEHVVKQGKQVIMLIPEIALTFQTVQRFYRRFGDQVSILNSRMSKGERYDQFLRAMRGEISIMIGPRSALFTPFPNLGLIVIDEEHENAYKSEQSPRYHARETAIHIAKESNASVVLGSATPSVGAFYRAQKGEYELFTLNNRATNGTLPQVYTEDMREELKSGNRSVFSRRLQMLMTDRLKKKQQIILFLNKRGYAGFISCRSCGHVMKCPHCDISLTSHNNGKLICHYCGYEQPAVTVCPECGSKYISGFRAGTQQIEQLVRKMYPNARTLRMDMDTTTGKDGHEKILSAFANQEADILIGTQMIVKGHDFPKVTLVGILAADMSLYADDYRASERTFQLLTQAAGRAGRGEDKGEVVIQTYTPDNYSIITAAAQDYLAFYDQEIAFRQMMGYPPVRHLMTISMSSKNEDALTKAADQLKMCKLQFLNELFEKDVQTEIKTQLDGNIVSAGDLNWIGPTNASIYKINDCYTKIMIVKSSDYDILTKLKDKIEIYISKSTYHGNVNTQFDFD